MGREPRCRIRRAPLTGVVLGLTVVVTVACQDAGAGPDGLLQIVVWPKNQAISDIETLELRVFGITTNYDSVAVDASWSTSAGSILTFDNDVTLGVFQPDGPGTAVVTVSLDTLRDSTTITVERQGGGGVLFKSDWSSGSVSDGGSWTNVSNHNALVSANGLDFPAALNNVLRQTYPSGGMQSVWVQSSAAAWSAPAVGESRYFRLYYRQDWRAGGIGGNGHHWIQANPGTCAYEWQWIIEPNGNGTFNVRYGLTLLNPGGRFGPVTLNEDTTYRFEWRLHRTASNSVKYEVRVYDPAGALVLDTDDVPGLASATGTPNVNCLRNMLIGYNGGNNISVESYQYIGAVAVCEDDWCGPYTGGN